MIERKRTIKNKVDDKTTEINNNINIKVSNEPPPVPEVPIKKKRKKRKKKISKSVKDDFLNTLNEYKASGGQDSTVNIGDIKKLTEPEVIDITNNLRTKILALKAPPVPPKAIAGATSTALPAPTSRMALPPPTTDYSQIPPRASQGFSNLRPSSLPPVEVRPSSLPPVEKRETSLQPKSSEDRAYKLFDLLTELNTLIENNQNADDAYIKTLNYYILNKYYFNGINNNAFGILIISYINEKFKGLSDDEKRNASKLFIGQIVKIRKQIMEEEPQPKSSSELIPKSSPSPSQEPISPSPIAILQSPETFYNTYYPNGVYTESRGKPSLKELKEIISSNYSIKGISNKPKAELVEIFQKLYKDSLLISKTEPTTEPTTEPPTPPQEFSSPQTTPREMQPPTPTEFTPETCRNSSRRGGIFNPCLGEYEKYLKDLINTNNTRELKIQYEKALKKQPSPVMSNVAIVNDIIELTDYVPQLANDNFYKYEMSQRGLTSNQTDDIIKKFYKDFYPDGEYTSATAPTYDKIIEMIQLLDPTFTTDETDEIILSAVFIDKYNKKFPKPVVEDDTTYISDYDEVYIKRSEEAENVELLEAIYKRYFKKDFVVQPDRTSRGDITFDIVQALNTKKKSLTDSVSVKSPPPTIEQNEVYLSFLICNGSYDTVRAESFNQVKYLPQYSDTQVAVYQDDKTIYFCSVGSRSPLALNEQQSREDWLQSDLAILLGLSTSAFSPRFDEEVVVLNRVVSAIQPSVVIFTGHSLGGRLSNELFFNAIKNTVSYQPFSITFNAGSGIPQFIDRSPFNPDYIKNRILQFHVNYDPLSATNIFGTIVGLPATMFTFSHQLTNFGPFEWTPYQNFIENGLKYTQPYKDPNDKTATITPEAGDVIVPQNTPQPYTNPQEVDTEVVPEIINPPSIEIIRKLKILEPFYTRFYPSGVFKQLNNIKPSVYELVYMIRLIDPNFSTDGLTRDMLQKILNDKYVKYKEENQFVNTDNIP